MKDLFVTEEDVIQAQKIIRKWNEQLPPERYSLRQMLFISVSWFLIGVITCFWVLKILNLIHVK